VNNAEILDLLLEGAAATKPDKGRLFSGPNTTLWNPLVTDIYATCAVGAIEYALAIQRGWNYVNQCSDGEHKEFLKAMNILRDDYHNRYGTNFVSDNDLYSRDFVVARVKELVNEQESLI
jgi:hypothetical protein